MSSFERGGLATLSVRSKPGPTAMANRPGEDRISPRRRNLKAGKALLSASTLVDCTIRELSDTGVCLEFGRMTTITTEFKLRIVAADQTKPVELAWQRGMTAGDRFQLAPG